MASFTEAVTFTGARYDDNKKVPRRTYRCRAKIGQPGHMHPCKLVTEHNDLKHECVCGTTWERSEGEK
ncbi:hypothetical protein SEA_FORK_89 [Microbacterium phage Fork]|nr:hypothetical protein SEA_FORK_89 [Microbacterium phage Fork]WNO25983.1 hypothetical protein SEA_ASEGATO_91 [Microbacterium phage ASegato]